MKINRSVLMLLSTAIAGMALSGCGGGGGGGGGSAWISHAWYDVYGNYCYTGTTPSPGCDFFSNGDKATYWDDPNFAPLTYGSWTYTDVYGYPAIYTGWARNTSDGIIYDENGNAVNSINGHSRDVITNAAAAEKAAINGAAQNLEAKYGLSVDTAMNIATSLNQWALIGKTRRRTDQDVAEFTKRLTGLDIGQINAALEAASNGDMTAADQAISQAAANWSTSPDTMKKIISDWYMTQSAGKAN